MKGSAITFTSGEVGVYYAERVPHLKQRSTDEWRGPCPIHGGTHNNFAVESATGRWFCHSTCGRGGDILDLEDSLAGGDFPTLKARVFRLMGRSDTASGRIGTGARENSTNEARSTATEPTDRPLGWREVERYAYVDNAGQTTFEVVRYLNPNGDKAFKQCRPDGNGSVIWNLDGVERVPYRLLQLLQADTVYLVEGEKDVHTLEGWGLVASCNPGGSGSSHLYAGWLQYFGNRNVVVIPDNDQPGRRHAVTVAETLLGTAASVRMLELPDLPAKGDVTDWRESGRTLEQFRELAVAATPMDAAALSELREQWRLAGPDKFHSGHAEQRNEWPRPEPIQSELPPVEAFSDDLLPDSFRALVADLAERMQVPTDYPAVALVLCLGGVVNRRALIQPKANDTGWVVVPNLWGGIIAPPGFLKSPVIQAATRPLNLIQSDWQGQQEEALSEYARQKEEHELRRAAWKEQFKAASKKGKAAPDRPDAEPEQPKLRRLVVNDATFEALHQIMSENPAGIMVIRDELTGWWSQLDRAGREGERAFCLQAWNGDTGHTIDRIGRGTIHVEACCMSMLGGIQPGRLRSYLVDALEDGPGNDGLIQRFQLLVWPDTAQDWTYVDRAPDQAMVHRVVEVFRTLGEMKAEEPALFRFAADAQELFIEWLEELEAKIRGEELHPALVSHLSKYRSLMPSLALLFELADRAGSEGFDGSSLAGSPNFVALQHALRAARWCDYLESHARRVYSCIVTPQLLAARELADKIAQRKLGTDGTFSCRDVYVKGWVGLDKPDVVRRAAEVLQDAGWVRELHGESGPSGGRPSKRYAVNPLVFE